MPKCTQRLQRLPSKIASINGHVVRTSSFRMPICHKVDLGRYTSAIAFPKLIMMTNCISHEDTDVNSILFECIDSIHSNTNQYHSTLFNSIRNQIMKLITCGIKQRQGMLLCDVTFGPSIWKDLAFFNFLGPSWDTIVKQHNHGSDPACRKT